jgi:hypothetical protein
MAGEDMVRRLLGEQRRRLVASLLGAAESSSWWPQLAVVEQRAYRDKVLASIGIYHDFCLDVLKVSGEDSVRNERALTLIEQVHASQRRLERQHG